MHLDVDGSASSSSHLTAISQSPADITLILLIHRAETLPKLLGPGWGVLTRLSELVRRLPRFLHSLTLIVVSFLTDCLVNVRGPDQSDAVGSDTTGDVGRSGADSCVSGTSDQVR
jgi:hypothetical protein